jgi:hypothetical protein
MSGACSGWLLSLLPSRYDPGKLFRVNQKIRPAG